MKRMVACVLLLCMVCGLCACGATEAPKGETAKTTRTEPNLLGVSIRELLTKEEIEKALDTTVREPQVSNEGRSMFTLAEDSMSSMSVSMEKRTKEQFDLSVVSLKEGGMLTESPNIGQEAWWHSDARALILYAEGYSMSFSVTGSDMDEETSLLAARELAVCVIDRL